MSADFIAGVLVGVLAYHGIDSLLFPRIAHRWALLRVAHDRFR